MPSDRPVSTEPRPDAAIASATAAARASQLGQRLGERRDRGDPVGRELGEIGAEADQGNAHLVRPAVGGELHGHGRQGGGHRLGAARCDQPVRGLQVDQDPAAAVGADRDQPGEGRERGRDRLAVQVVQAATRAAATPAVVGGRPRRGRVPVHRRDPQVEALGADVGREHGRQDPAAGPSARARCRSPGPAAAPTARARRAAAPPRPRPRRPPARRSGTRRRAATAGSGGAGRGRPAPRRPAATPRPGRRRSSARGLAPIRPGGCAGRCAVVLAGSAAPPAPALTRPPPRPGRPARPIPAGSAGRPARPARRRAGGPARPR